MALARETVPSNDKNSRRLRRIKIVPSQRQAGQPPSERPGGPARPAGPSASLLPLAARLRGISPGLISSAGRQHHLRVWGSHLVDSHGKPLIPGPMPETYRRQGAGVGRSLGIFGLMCRRADRQSVGRPSSPWR